MSHFFSWWRDICSQARQNLDQELQKKGWKNDGGEVSLDEGHDRTANAFVSGPGDIKNEDTDSSGDVSLTSAHMEVDFTQADGKVGDRKTELPLSKVENLLSI